MKGTTTKSLEMVNEACWAGCSTKYCGAARLLPLSKINLEDEEKKETGTPACDAYVKASAPHPPQRWLVTIQLGGYHSL